MKKRPFMKRIKELNPVWFVKTSLSYMAGHPKHKVWLQMVPTYFRYAKATMQY